MTAAEAATAFSHDNARRATTAAAAVAAAGTAAAAAGKGKAGKGTKAGAGKARQSTPGKTSKPAAGAEGNTATAATTEAPIAFRSRAPSRAPSRVAAGTAASSRAAASTAAASGAAAVPRPKFVASGLLNSEESDPVLQKLERVPLKDWSPTQVAKFLKDFGARDAGNNAIVRKVQGRDLLRMKEADLRALGVVATKPLLADIAKVDRQTDGSEVDGDGSSTGLSSVGWKMEKVPESLDDFMDDGDDYGR